MGNMSVLVIWIINVLQPLLKLAVFSDLHGRQTVPHHAQRIRKGIFCIEEFCCLDNSTEGIKNKLVIHGSTGIKRVASMGLGCVFGRCSRAYYQPFLFRMFDKKIYIERSGSLQRRMNGLKVLHVPGVKIVLAEMLSGRSSTPARCPPEEGSYRCRYSPCVRIVMGHPSPCSMHNRGSFFPCL